LLVIIVAAISKSQKLLFNIMFIKKINIFERTSIIYLKVIQYYGNISNRNKKSTLSNV